MQAKSTFVHLAVLSAISLSVTQLIILVQLSTRAKLEEKRKKEEEKRMKEEEKRLKEEKDVSSCSQVLA